MAMMDLIKLCGSSPATCCDLSGGATEAKVNDAIEIISSNPRVKAILVTIFGGIFGCDSVARGIISAVQSSGCNLPIIARLEGC